MNPIHPTLNPLAALGAAAFLPLAGHAALVNGDFESDPFDTGWTNADASFVSTTGFAPGSTTAALAQPIDATTDDLDQLTASGLSNGTLGFWFRPDSIVVSERNFNLVVGTTAGLNAVNLRMQGDATGTTLSLDYFIGGGTWLTAGSGFTSGDVYYLELGFNGFGTAGASYDLAWSDANPGSATTSNSLTGITQFQNAGHATTAGATIDRLRFRTDGDWGAYALDDVSLVPEPSAALLGCLGLLGLLRRRR